MQQTLAYRMRPQHLADVLGQQHLVGPGQILSRLVKNKHPLSMILYGPPGCGKTTIASCLEMCIRDRVRSMHRCTSTPDLSPCRLQGGL